MRKFTAAVFTNDQSSATSWLKRALRDSSDGKECSFTAGKIRSQEERPEVYAEPLTTRLSLDRPAPRH